VVSNSFFAVAVNVFTAPAEAFAAIKERPRVLAPLLLMLCAYAAMSYLYVNRVDLGWLVEHQLETSGAQVTAEQRAQAVENMARIPKPLYGALGAGGTALAIAIVIALSALYYTGVSFVRGDGVKYKEWFSLICHCMLPTLFGILAQIVHLFVVDARFMPQEQLNPLSFRMLFDIRGEGLPMVQRTLLSLDPTTLWSVALSVLGYQTFAKASTAKAAAIVLAPIVVIVAIATVVAM
jgi:hypothetical protein